MDTSIKHLRYDYLRIKASGLRKHQKSQILNAVERLGWTFVNEPITEDIHTIDRRIQIRSYLDNGAQNMEVHEWHQLKLLDLSVEYAGSNFF